MNELLTISDVASLCQVQPELIQAHFEAGRLTGVNIGIKSNEDIWRFHNEDIARFYNILRDDNKVSAKLNPAIQKKIDLPAIVRLNIKPDAAAGVDPKAFCFNKGVAGMGHPVPNTPSDWDNYRQLAAAEYPSGSWTPVIVLHDIPVGGVIWTRSGNTSETTFWVGLVTGSWKYLDDSDAKAADIVNVRPVVWYKVGGYQDVPDAIKNAFTPAVIAQIRNQEGIEFTEVLAHQLVSQGVWKII